MSDPVEAPTPKALADLVARCNQINRFAVQLTAAEESRIAALASGILVMREVLDLDAIVPERLPARQARIHHWALTGGRVSDLATPAIKRLSGKLVLDEHEQVKVLSNRSWRGQWRQVTLWRDGVHDLSARDLMEYLARLATDAQERAPDAARALLRRSEDVAAVGKLIANGPRTR